MASSGTTHVLRVEKVRMASTSCLPRGPLVIKIAVRIHHEITTDEQEHHSNSVICVVLIDLQIDVACMRVQPGEEKAHDAEADHVRSCPSGAQPESIGALARAERHYGAQMVRPEHSVQDTCNQSACQWAKRQSHGRLSRCAASLSEKSEQQNNASI
mmetsp:Transcript_23978/g.44039  ORF Transcript_23978/g.44039 Transcript_23978/m.44039 type:complete len:157 (-) Transcript_23978:185-655(-)